MSPAKAAVTPCEIYNHALKYSRHDHVPPGVPLPNSTNTWLAENIAILERYVTWLAGGGTSAYVIRVIHIPMAGHILSLNHKPSAALDLDNDLQAGMDYILAKKLGFCWTKNCRLSMLKFRRFLLHERGQTECHITPFDPVLHTEGLPTWLVEQLTRYQHVKQRNWRESRIEDGIRRFWCEHLRLWRFLVRRFGIQALSDLKRSHFLDYVDWQLQARASVRGVNGDLRTFHGFMEFLQEQDWPVPHILLRMPCLKEPDPLPKSLTDSQVCSLRDDLEARVAGADNAAHCRDALLDRATFYLLWQGGLRRGEVEDLRLEDLYLEGRKLTVRRGKGLVDRTVFLSQSVVRVLLAYLPMRGPGPTDHVFLYRNQALSKDLIHGRLKACGERVGVSVYAHRLRHTCATQLLNAGCPVTSIQKFLGHKRLNTTMVYARAYDQTVEADYFAAMSRVEQRLLVAPEPEPTIAVVTDDEKVQILAIAGQLAAPEAEPEMRRNLFEQMLCLLFGGQTFPETVLSVEAGSQVWIPPPVDVAVG